MTAVNDISCATFTLASDTKAKDANGNYIPIYYRVTVWRRLAENVARYLHKGDPVTVHGDLSLRSYVDREGQNRTNVLISANHVEFPGRRSSAVHDDMVAPSMPSVPTAPAMPQPADDDELPF